MMRSLWLLFKIGVVIALVIWIAERPGTITIDWLEYKATFHIGLFIIAMLLIVILGIVIFSIIKAALDLPGNIARYKEIISKDKGVKALTIGLTAVAAGDAKSASYQAQRARYFLKEDNALSGLLEAQSARLDGREMDAARAFIELMDNKNSEFLGIRGLLQSALDCGDYSGALELANRALELHPSQTWILQITYDLEIKANNWDRARKILYRLEKSNAINSEKANSDRVAMLLAEADLAKEAGNESLLYSSLNKAYKLDKHFIPTVLRLGSMYMARGKRKAVVSMVEKAWKSTPHPELVELWGMARPHARDNDPMAYVRWFEKLAGFVPESVEGLQALANILISEGLWGEARKKLEQAQDIRPNVNLYRIWARLEERATHDEMAVRSWLEKAADAPRERVWICSETGRIYEQWMPISDQGLFNTIIWDFPQGRNIPAVALGNMYLSKTLLQAPKNSCC